MSCPVPQLEGDPILNHVFGDMAGKDSRSNLEILKELRWKLVNLDFCILDVSGSDRASIAHDSVGGQRLRAGGGTMIEVVDADGHALPLSAVPQLDRVARVRTLCGNGYTPGVAYELKCEGSGQPFVG